MENNRKELLLEKLKENNLEFREDSGLYKHSPRNSPRKKYNPDNNYKYDN